MKALLTSFLVISLRAQIAPVSGFGTIHDAAFDNLRTACTAAITAGKWLLLTSQWMSVPSQTCSANISFAGGRIQPAFSNQVILTGDIRAGAVQIFDYSAGGRIILSGPTREVYPQYWGPGLDIGAQVNAAIASLGASTCGNIKIPQGHYAISTPINADDTRGCTIEGFGAPTGGAAPATELIYNTSDNSSIISARSSASFTLRGIMLLAQGSSFTGKWVDLGHSGPRSFDTFQAVIEWNGFFATNGGTASVGIDLSKSMNTTVRNNNISGRYLIGIRGIADDSEYANGITIWNNHFSSSTGAAMNAAILNPGEAWTIGANTFEMGQAAGPAKAIACNLITGIHTGGVKITGNWMGDWTAGTTGGVGIEVCGGGWSIDGNYLAGPIPGDIKVIEIKINSIGLTVSGNRFDINTGSTPLWLTGNLAQLWWAANEYTNPVSIIHGVPASGVLMDITGRLVVYGPNAGITRTIVVRGSGGANCNLVVTNGWITSTNCP